jgi:4-hydroxy-tetrahydrodipicolinate synthase
MTPQALNLVNLYKDGTVAAGWKTNWPGWRHDNLLTAGRHRMRTPPIHAMVVTPFNEAGTIDESGFRAVVRFAAAGGNAIWVASQGSGEGLVLTAGERRLLYRLAVLEAGKDVPVLAAGIGLGGTDAAIEDAQAALAAGVAAVQILPPRPGPVAIGLREDELLSYYEDVLAAVDGPVFLANNQPLAGMSLSIAMIEGLVSRHARIVGVNYTTFDLRSFAELASRLAGKVEIRSGVISQLPAVRALGGSGMLCFEPNVDAHAAMAAWKGHDGDGSFRRLMDLNLALTRAGNPRSLKAALELQKRGKAVLRRPLLPPLPHEWDMLRKELAELDLLDLTRDHCPAAASVR